MPGDSYEQLDASERWFSDLYRYVDPPGFILWSRIDMSRCREIIELARRSGIHITYSHLIVRAVGLALHRMQDLHCVVERSRRFIPSTVDASIPIGGTGLRFSPSTVVVRDIGRLKLAEVAAAMVDRAETARHSEPAELLKLRRLSFLINRKWFRALVIPRLLGSAKWRRQYMGTVTITFLKDIEGFLPMTPFAGLVVAAGQVHDAPVAVNGTVCVRPVINLSCCVDHKVWDGLTAARFMGDVKQILTGGELEAELEASLANEPASALPY